MMICENCDTKMIFKNDIKTKDKIYNIFICNFCEKEFFYGVKRQKLNGEKNY